MMDTLRFVSRNEHKLREAAAILSPRGITVLAFKEAIDELQTTNVSKLVRDKVMKAYGQVGRPLFVEHTALFLKHLNGLPGGLTQIFWDSLEADRFSELFGRLAPSNEVTAKTTIGYCDGKRIHMFEGEIAGQIVDAPRGGRDFQWDCVFQPDGFKQTFSEMGSRKNDISMRRIALQKLADYLSSVGKP